MLSREGPRSKCPEGISCVNPQGMALNVPSSALPGPASPHRKRRAATGWRAKHLSRLPESLALFGAHQPYVRLLPYARRTHLSALLLGSAVVAACGGGSSGSPPTPVEPEKGVLSVHATEWRFDPPRIVLRLGKQVRIELQNEGQVLHNFKIDSLQADVAGSSSTGPLSAGQGELFVGAAVDQGGTLVFTPRETGSFTFYCSIPRHRQLGMKGTIFVQ